MNTISNPRGLSADMPEDRQSPPLTASGNPQVDADLTVTGLLASVRELQKISNKSPHLIAGEREDIRLAAGQLNRILEKMGA